MKLMASKGLSAHVVCLLAVLALLALQLLWPGRWQPGAGNAGWVFAMIASLPWAVLALALWRRLPSARFWSGVTALFYFCHGIAEAWAVPDARVPGLLEVLLSVIVVLASSWAGLQARLGARARRNV